MTFKLSDETKGLRDWFCRNSQMVRDDDKGDKWVISKKKFNEFTKLVEEKDKEFIRLLKEKVCNEEWCVDRKFNERWIDKLSGFSDEKVFVGGSMFKPKVKGGVK